MGKTFSWTDKIDPDCDTCYKLIRKLGRTDDPRIQVLLESNFARHVWAKHILSGYLRW